MANWVHLRRVRPAGLVELDAAAGGPFRLGVRFSAPDPDTLITLRMFIIRDSRPELEGGEWPS